MSDLRDRIAKAIEDVVGAEAPNADVAVEVADAVLAFADRRIEGLTGRSAECDDLLDELREELRR